ncbi:unnamed protein product, partial [Mesorhabditis belari]|uniref:Choline/ethanolamine kinase n=1 Tax=Mesorhabditis belari TaxID=2138241 RepID=A0AAF3FCB9_9BILA
METINCTVKENSTQKQCDRHPSGDRLKEVYSQFSSDSTSTKNAEPALATTRFLCSKYMGGIWARAAATDYSVKPITGGMSNLLFLVELQGEEAKNANEPTKTLLRIHCQGDLNQQLTESVVFTLLSERGLGPRLLGIFPGGRFEQFIESRALTCSEISQPRFARILAPMVGRVHTLDVPITKEPQTLLVIKNWIAELEELIGERDIKITTKQAKVDVNRVPSTIRANDLYKEVEFYQKFLDVANSPIVFSHNDLQEGNFLLANGYRVEEDGVKAEGKVENNTDPMVLIDFEYASYNYRGFDFGNHLCEYAFDYSSSEAPFYEIFSDRFNDVEGRRTFATAYVDKIYELKSSAEMPHFPSDLVTGDREKDIEKVVEESILFMSLSHLFWSCWALVNAENALVQFEYGSYGRDRLALYFDAKHLLEEFIRKHSS